MPPAIVARHLGRLSAPAPVVLDADGRFVCPRHAGGLTITPAFCARLFARGEAAGRSRDPVDLVAVAPCMGCPTGAHHAGHDAPAAAPAFVPGQPLHFAPRETRVARSKAGARQSGAASTERARAARRAAR